MNYDWSQTWDYVTINIFNYDKVESFVLTSKHIKVKCKNFTLEGDLSFSVYPDESTWYIENNSIFIELAKVDRSQHWERLCIGFPEKDMDLTPRGVSDFTPEQESIFRRMKLQQDQDIRNNPKLVNNS